MAQRIINTSKLLLTDSPRTINTSIQVPPVVIPYAASFITNMLERNAFKITLTGNSTWNFSNPRTGNYQLTVKQDDLGGHTLTLGTDIKLTNPAQVITSAKSITIYSFIYDEDEGKVFATVSPFV